MKEQDEIKRILFDNDRSKSWLAKKLGITAQSLQYKLDVAPDLSLEFYRQIMKIFKAEGFISSANEQCEYLIQQTLQIDSMIGNALTMLNRTVQKTTLDHVLDFNEKRKLFELIEKIKSDFEDELGKIENILKGKSDGCA